VIDSDLLRSMAADLGFLPGQLVPVIRTAPLRYKVYTVPKKNGGQRVLAQPAREVKAMQYWVMDYLRPFIPVHSAATAYEKGMSIKENASRHADGIFLLKMDFSNFFPSILSSDFNSHLKMHCSKVFSSAEHDMIDRILFWAPGRSPPLRLCIGAPSSPFVSNTVMYEFDLAVHRLCLERGVVYTRYADDLTFSTSLRNVLGEIPGMVGLILQEISYPRLSINNRKTIHASRKTLRKVTGIVLTPNGALSVGRDRKRLVHSMCHRAMLGQLDLKQIEVLHGLVAFISSVEPGFEEKLMKKYKNLFFLESRKVHS
jgi:RNA-directed DNA polymerase